MCRELIYFQLKEKSLIDSENGFYKKQCPEGMSDFHFYRVTKGDEIICSDQNYCYSVAFYSEKIEERFIYTYCYQEEENWATYQEMTYVDVNQNNKYVVLQDGYIRVCAQRADGKRISEEDVTAAKLALVLSRKRQTYHKKLYYDEEIKQTVESTHREKSDNSLLFAVVADSHYVINGGWEDTISNLKAVHEQAGFDAVIHLGDLTDGMTPLSITKEYTSRIMQDLESLQIPVYLTLGNHDSNYFNKNPEWMTQEEQSYYYLDKEKPWYYVDLKREKLRRLFLYSFDHREKVRYGFPEEEVAWVKEILDNTSDDYSVLIFSHVPLLPEMHFWTSEIRNSGEMLQILEDYVCRGGRILGYIHGHNHADQINTEKKFPIISVGCAKCEDFKDKKPEGSITYDRKMGTVTQELWDVLIVDPQNGKLDFVRFGAGEDRSVCLN